MSTSLVDFASHGEANREEVSAAYLAYEEERVSRIVMILIWPGY